MALVLCTGVDSVLMHTRKVILERAGHTVVPAINEGEIASACRLCAFDVAILGQALSPKSKRHIAFIIRQRCPSAKILELCPALEDRAVDDADSWLEAPSHRPEEFAIRVAELAESPKRKAQSGTQELATRKF
jgi:hypothetical protein